MIVLIGLNLVCEKDELVYSLDINTVLDKGYVLDYFDFDNQSFEDYIDYLDFVEFDKYIFVTFGESVRLERIISYLREFLKTEFQMIHIDGLESFLSRNSVQNVKEELEKNVAYNSLINLNTKNIFDNGYKAFKTSLYPSSVPKGLFKHIFVDNFEEFYLKNQNLLRFFSINSAVYVEDNRHVDNSFPLILKDINNFRKIQLVSISPERLYEEIEYFYSTGKININKFIKDYGFILGMFKFNSLILKKQNFYIDQDMKYEIGATGDQYESLFNKVSQIVNDKRFNDVPENFKFLFPILVEIEKIFGSVEFITPFNDFFLSRTNFNEPLTWISYKKQGEYFVYNIANERLFRVNKNFIVEFEHKIKKVNSNCEETFREVEELLNANG